MIYPAYNIICNFLETDLGLTVLKGSLRHFQVVIPTPSVIVVPINIGVGSEGGVKLVRERYNIVTCINAKQSQPFNAVVDFTVEVAKQLQAWRPSEWHDAITFKALTVNSIEFDTHPEADDLGVITGTIECEVAYYAI